MSDDLHDEELQFDLDSRSLGMYIDHLTDEDELSLMEGLAEELLMASYESIKPLSAQCIYKMYNCVLVICGTVGGPLSKRYHELHDLDEYVGKDVV